MTATENNQLSRAKKKTDSQGQNKSPKKKSKKKQSRWLLYTVIAFIALLLGSMIGYGIVGGRNALEVLDLDTWLHMYRLIFG